jgi:hypothetical protein
LDEYCSGSSYQSNKLNFAQSEYSTIERELLAVLPLLKHSQHLILTSTKSRHCGNKRGNKKLFYLPGHKTLERVAKIINRKYKNAIAPKAYLNINITGPILKKPKQKFIIVGVFRLKK